jgi:biopolymer transport protein ExbD
MHRRVYRRPPPLSLAAPWICVFIPFAFFTLFHEYLVLPRGVRITLPAVDAPAAAAPGERLLVVAVDANGRPYFENQRVELAALPALLAVRAAGSNGPRTLLIHADAGVTAEALTAIAGAASAAGLRDIILASRPVMH